MSKEREAFEAWAYSNKWNIFRVRDADLDHYVDDFVNGAWHGWQAKAQAVPEGFVLVQLDVVERCMSHICLAMCHQNNSNSENDVMQMDLETLESALGSQHLSSSSDCPDEP